MSKISVLNLSMHAFDIGFWLGGKDGLAGSWVLVENCPGITGVEVVWVFPLAPQNEQNN